MGSSFHVFCCASVLPTLRQIDEAVRPFSLSIDGPPPRSDQRWAEVVMHGDSAAEVRLRCEMRTTEAGELTVRAARDALSRQRGYGLWWVSSHLDRTTFVVEGNVQGLREPTVQALAEALARTWNGVVLIDGQGFYRDGRPLTRRRSEKD